ncbi:sulfatase-like hydrolase/transferase [Alphaproteobacteria bacterium]|nr:sulfatase-like hydrolase/transferase [Alphaproteobacteria bacterium]
MSKNLLILLSDEHNKRMLGVSGHSHVKTPNLDKLANEGTLFNNAYCNSPICVPSRAILATGRYNAEIGYWDNADPYDGNIPSWGHRAVQGNCDAVSIGKLHFLDDQAPTGFSEQINPLNVVGGVGDLLGLIRQELPVRKGAANMAKDVGSGETTYSNYDKQIAEDAKNWISNRKKSDKPWVLFVSFVCPHFPLIAPEEFYNMYPESEVPWPLLYEESQRSNHPYYKAMRKCMNYDDYFDEEKVRKATSAYFGLCSFLDYNIGTVLSALDNSDFADNTNIIYTSDHGDALGMRGMWGKSTMFEESAGVPMIIKGPNLPVSKKVKTPVSLVDIFPTVIDSLELDKNIKDDNLPGKSLLTIANENDDYQRVVLSEYHAAASPVGAFMLRKGKYKYVYFAEGYKPQLFNLEEDQFEENDLALDQNFSNIVDDFYRDLLDICDPEEVNKRAKKEQNETILKHGGIEAIQGRGDFGYSPAPGQKVEFD